MREQVWINKMGKRFSGTCCISWCENDMSCFNFDCGHNIPESKGGPTNIENLIPNTTKVDGLIDYKYSIAIENCKKNNYISEKFTDCILCGTMPIYYGADNVTDYFPKDCFYSIDIESPTCLVDLYNILKKPISEKNKNAIKQARDLILNKYNMLEKLNEIIKS